MSKEGATKQPRVQKDDSHASKKSAADSKQHVSESAAVITSAAASRNSKEKNAANESVKKPAKEKSADAANGTKEKVKKAKLVRDSFTMPEAEYKLIAEVKRDCLQAGVEVKKSELLRVGVALVRQMEMDKLKAALSALPALKAGRPKKEK